MEYRASRTKTMTKIEENNLALNLAIHRAGPHFGFGASTQKLCKTNPISNTRFAMNPRQSEQIDPRKAGILPKISHFFTSPYRPDCHKSTPFYAKQTQFRTPAPQKTACFFQKIPNFSKFFSPDQTAHTAKIACKQRPNYAKQTQFPEC